MPISWVSLHRWMFRPWSVYLSEFISLKPLNLFHSLTHISLSSAFCCCLSWTRFSVIISSLNTSIHEVGRRYGSHCDPQIWTLINNRGFITVIAEEQLAIDKDHLDSSVVDLYRWEVFTSPVCQFVDLGECCETHTCFNHMSERLGFFLWSLWSISHEQITLLKYKINNHLLAKPTLVNHPYLNVSGFFLCFRRQFAWGGLFNVMLI